MARAKFCHLEVIIWSIRQRTSHHHHHHHSPFAFNSSPNRHFPLPSPLSLHNEPPNPTPPPVTTSIHNKNSNSTITIPTKDLIKAPPHTSYPPHPIPFHLLIMQLHQYRRYQNNTDTFYRLPSQRPTFDTTSLSHCGYINCPPSLAHSLCSNDVLVSIGLFNHPPNTNQYLSLGNPH